MYLFSRVVFACVGVMIGSVLGVVASLIFAAVLLRDSDGAPGDGVMLLFLLMLGAMAGAVIGLALGIMGPIWFWQRQKQARQPGQFSQSKGVWPPPTDPRA